MRELGGILAKILGTLKTNAKPGITTKRLDEIAETECGKFGVNASSYGYHGFPGHLCISLNQTVIHGIPGDTKIKNGDMVSFDLVIDRDGLFVDSAVTFAVGKPTALQAKLMEVTHEALLLGIDKAVPGNRIGDISSIVQSFVEKNGFSVIRDFVGHGVGSAMHEEPQIPNFGRSGTGVLIKPGMTLAIEPMVAAGDWHIDVSDDGWTADTRDGSLSCHFEHTIAVTEDGKPIILTSETNN